MKITTKGQVTIPQAIRERLGLLPHTEVDFEVRGDVVVVTKAGMGVLAGVGSSRRSADVETFP